MSDRLVATLPPMASRKEEIVRIAGELFAARGYVSTTVREIGERAGILSGSLYHHFESKEAIADHILTGYYTGMDEKFHAVVATSKDPADALAGIIREAYRGIAEQPNAVALIANSGDHLMASGRFPHIVKLNEELERIWLAVLRDGIKRKVFRETIDPRLIHIFIRDALWVTIRWWRPDGKYSIDEVADRYIDMLLGGILSGPAAASRKRAAARKKS